MTETFECPDCGKDSFKSEASLRAHKNFGHCPAKKEPAADQGQVEVEAMMEQVKELKKRLEAAEKRAGPELGPEIKFANGAVYKQVGECNMCRMPVYHCETSIRDDSAIGNRLACYVPGARTPESGSEAETALYCQAHDPTREMRHAGIARAYRGDPSLDDPFKDPLPQHYWEPQKG